MTDIQWKEKLFSVAPKFKEWIENTSLFHAIKNGHGIDEIVAHGEDETLYLNLHGRTVGKAEDLPLEIIQKFYENSPWFNPDEKLNFKLLNNDSTNTEIK